MQTYQIPPLKKSEFIRQIPEQKTENNGHHKRGYGIKQGVFIGAPYAREQKEHVTRKYERRYRKIDKKAAGNKK
jgi:hypothetical protein